MQVRAGGRARGLLGLALAVAALMIGARPLCAAEVRLGPASLSVIGQDSLTFRQESVSGSEVNRSAYRWDNYSQSAGFEHHTDLTIHGELLPDLRVDAAIASGPFSAGHQRLTFTFDGSDAAVVVGDLTVAFDQTLLAGFRRSLRGIQVESKLPRGALNLVASQSEPLLRTDTLYGGNSPGPYYLTASPVVDASEVIEVDGRPMRRGSDYGIDYQVGLLQFSPALIIPPTSRIVVSYEYDAPGSLSGTLIGLRAAYPVAPALGIGATYLTLQRRGVGDPACAQREDRWLGANSPGPFTLSHRPIEPGSERARLDGILQVSGRDYHIDYATGAIMFLGPVPVGVSIIVSYRVSGTAPTATPDRSLVALDAHYTAGGLALDAELAQSAGAPGSSGAAVALGARGQWDRLTLAANVRSSGAGFAPFESAGLKQIRSGYDWQLGFEPAAGLHLSAGMRDHRRPYYQASDASGPLVRDRTRELSLDFRRAGWPSLSYAGSWSALDAAQSLHENSSNQLLTLGYEREVYGVKATYRRDSYGRQGEQPASVQPALADGLSSLAPGDWALPYAGSGTGTALSFWYRPGSALNVTCDLARSAIAINDGGRSSADSRRLAVEYAPAANTSISVGYRASSTGEALTADGRRLPGSTNRSQLLSIRHSLRPDLSLSLACDTQMSQGGYGTDTDSGAVSLGMWWQPAASLALIGQFTRQDLAYLGAGGRCSNNITSLGATMGPFGPGVKLDLSYSRMSGSTSGDFGAGYDAQSTGLAASTGDDALAAAALGIRGTANSSMRARLSCALGGSHQAYAEWEMSRNSGDSGVSARRAVALGWEVALAHALSFTLDWRRTAGISTDPRYSYRAQTISGRLGLKL